jgi:hypothetical protein
MSNFSKAWYANKSSFGVDAIWDRSGQILALHPCRKLGEREIAELLRSGVKQFVRVGCQYGHEATANRPPRGTKCSWPLEWIPADNSYDFWKDDVKPRLVEPTVEQIYLDDYPGEYCYIATEWSGADGAVILLETLH